MYGWIVTPLWDVPDESGHYSYANDTSKGEFPLLGKARIGPQGVSIALQGSAKQHVGPANMPRIDHGAWVFGCLCTLIIGAVALYAGLTEDDRASTN